MNGGCVYADCAADVSPKGLVRHMIEAGHKRIRFMARLARSREETRTSRETADAVARLEPALAA